MSSVLDGSEGSGNSVPRGEGALRVSDLLLRLLADSLWYESLCLLSECSICMYTEHECEVMKQPAAMRSGTSGPC